MKGNRNCPVCGGSGVEEVYGGHGTVLELECTEDTMAFRSQPVPGVPDDVLDAMADAAYEPIGTADMETLRRVTERMLGAAEREGWGLRQVRMSKERDARLYAAALHVIGVFCLEKLNTEQRAHLANEIVREIERRKIV